MDTKPKSFWKNAWNEPRLFFLWLTILSIAGLAAGFFLDVHTPWFHPPDWFRSGAIIVAACLGLGVMTGLLGFALAWIPPVRRLLARLLQRRFFVLACMITFIALVYAEEDWRGWHAWQKFKHEWEAKGEKFNFADFIPPSVPDDQNFALTPIVASSYEAMVDKSGREVKPHNTNVVNRLEMPPVRNYNDWPTNGGGNREKATLTDLRPWQDYYRTLAATTNLFPTSPQPQTPAQDVLLALSKYDSTIEELRQASKLPYSRFPLEYDKDDPAAILLPHLAVLKQCTQILRLRATAELQNGQSEKALEDVKLMLYLNQSTRTEPVLISHLVRIAMAEITLLPIYEGLAEHKWSDTQLAALDAELAKLDFLADYEFSMRGERVFGISMTEYLRRTRNLQAMGFDDQGDPSSPLFSNLGFHLAPASFFYRSELTMARVHQQWTLPLVDVENRIVSPQTFSKSEVAANRELKHGWPYNILARMVFPAVQSTVKKYAREQSSLDLARVAIALERYRLAHGEFPETPGALAPQFMVQVPHDIINGEPLHYRRETNGQFVLYSVGWNETDDGGVVRYKKGGNVPDFESGDLVWRYPQK